MIEKVELTNFKGFKRVELGPLSRVTLLGGRNGVGKSSILEAIFMFFDRGNPEFIVRPFTWRGMSKLFASADQLFSPIFYDFNRTKAISIRLTVDGREEKLRLSFKEQAPERRVVFEKFGKIHSATATEERPIINCRFDLQYSGGGRTENSMLIITDRGFKVRDEKTTPEKRPAIYLSPRVPASPAEDAQRFGELDIRGQVAGAVAYLQAFEPRIQGLSSIFYSDTALIHADIGASRKIPVPQLGEGLSFALSLYLAMSAARDGVLLVDELGSGIHHSILETLWAQILKASHAFNCQLIASTHSYETLEAATNGLASEPNPEFAFIRLDREADAIVPRPYAFPILEAAVDAGWEVR